MVKTKCPCCQAQLEASAKIGTPIYTVDDKTRLHGTPELLEVKLDRINNKQGGK